MDHEPYDNLNPLGQEKLTDYSDDTPYQCAMIFPPDYFSSIRFSLSASSSGDSTQPPISHRWKILKIPPERK